MEQTCGLFSCDTLGARDSCGRAYRADSARGRLARHVQGSDEGADSLSHALAAAVIHESAGDATSSRGSISSQECKRNSGGNSSRIAKWKDEAIQEGMRLVEVTVRSSSVPILSQCISCARMRAHLKHAWTDGNNGAAAREATE